MDFGNRDTGFCGDQVPPERPLQVCGHGTAAWARALRHRGITLPVYAGVPGAVTRQKLVRISASLGLGPSARYLLKQNNMLLRFFLPGGYRPDRLVTGLGSDIAAGDSAVAGLHFFTFNELDRTEAWRQGWLERLRTQTV